MFTNSPFLAHCMALLNTLLPFGSMNDSFSCPPPILSMCARVGSDSLLVEVLVWRFDFMFRLTARLPASQMRAVADLN